MSIALGTNLTSLRTARALSESQNKLSSVFERLSSGSRLNRASDDAASIALADDLKNSSRLNNQALKNVSDAISLFSIADSAISSLSSVMIRIEELSSQAANGVYSSKQRSAMDNEVQLLWDEFSRIAQTTKFNNINLLDGSAASVTFQVGEKSESFLTGSISAANAPVITTVGTGEFQSALTFSLSGGSADGIQLGDLNGDGNLDAVLADDYQISIMLGDGQGSFTNTISYAASDFNWTVSLGDLNSDGILDIVGVGEQYNGPGNYDGQITLLLGNGDGSFNSLGTYDSGETRRSFAVELADLDGDGILDLITSGTSDSNIGRVSIYSGDGDGYFTYLNTYTAEATGSRAIQIGDLNGDNILDLVTAGYTGTDGKITVRIGNGDGSFGSSSTFTADTRATYDASLVDLNNDGILDIVTAGRNDSAQATSTVLLGNGDGSFSYEATYNQYGSDALSVNIVDFNSDGNLDLVSASFTGAVSVRLGDGTNAFGSRTDYLTGADETSDLASGDVNNDGVLDILTAGNSALSAMTVNLAETVQGYSQINSFSLLSASDARTSLENSRAIRENLQVQRGQIGSFMSRLEVVSSTLNSKIINQRKAESRIRDADIASDSAQLTRLQILQNITSSILSQANIQPRLALELISS